jgi:16S rRNA G966 N2-methylase RsmD
MSNNQLIKNLLICGDNLRALDDLKKQGITADLIYLDPPFFSNKQYEVVRGDEAEVISFKDRWAAGINVYTAWMKERVIKMHDVLKIMGNCK